MRRLVAGFRLRLTLNQSGRLSRNKFAPSKKSTCFEQPYRAHQHWHIDISYLNIAGTFYFLCSECWMVIPIVHWEIETMKEPQ